MSTKSIEERREAKRLYMRRWNAANPEKVRAIEARKKAKDPEKHREAVREKNRRYKERYPEREKIRAREAQKNRRAKNPEAMRDYQNKWAAEARQRNANIDAYEGVKLLEAEFWDKVEKRGPDECWEWKGSRRSKIPQKAYGEFFIVTGKKVVASRAAYELTYGRLDPSLNACHTCDNPPCCNPKHLFAGDDKVNALDKVAKGRHGRTYTSRFTAEDVALIRSGVKSNAVLAREYGVAPSYISRIKSGHAIKSLPES